MLFHAKALVALSSLAALTFSLDQATLVAFSFNDHLQALFAKASVVELSVLLSAASVGATCMYAIHLATILTAVSSLVAGALCDAVGCLHATRLAALVWLAGCCAAYFLSETHYLVLAKLLKGCAVGTASVASQVYVFEIIRPSRRGGALSFHHWCSCFGALAIYATGLVLQQHAPTKRAFHYASACEGSWGVLVLIFLWLLPELPTHLARRGNWLGASKTYARLTATRRKILPPVPEQPTLVPILPMRYAELFSRRLFWHSVAAVVSQVVATLAGVCTVAHFVRYISVLCDVDSKTLQTLLGVHFAMQTAVALLPVFLLDRARRKDVLSFGLVLLVAAYSAMGALALVYGAEPPIRIAGPPIRLERLVASALLAFTAFAFSVSSAFVAPASALYCLEVLPVRARTKGAALACSAYWATNALVNAAILPLASEIHPHWIFFALAIVCFAGMVLVLLMRETQGLAHTEDVPFVARPFAESDELEKPEKNDTSASEPKTLDAKEILAAVPKYLSEESEMWRDSTRVKKRTVSTSKSLSPSSLPVDEQGICFQNFVPLHPSELVSSQHTTYYSKPSSSSSTVRQTKKREQSADLKTAKSLMSPTTSTTSHDSATAEHEPSTMSAMWLDSD